MDAANTTHNKRPCLAIARVYAVYHAGSEGMSFSGFSMDVHGEETKAVFITVLLLFMH